MSTDRRRSYVVVDDARSPVIPTFKVSPSQYAGLVQGETVTVRFTPNLGRVRWIISASDAAPAA
jgi:hypothetical protein